MNDLEHLRTVADESLAGLNAGPALRSRILTAAAAERTEKRQSRPTWMRVTAAAAACALILLVAIGAVMNHQKTDRITGPILTAMTAGDEPVANEQSTLNREHSNLSIVARNAGSAQGIWAANTDNGFPLVMLDGRIYRQITVHSLEEASLGQPIATIWDYSSEPALADGNVSNSMPAGTEIYAVSGMDKTLVACKTEDGIVAFQRVSYNGSATVKGEGFDDIMQLRGHVVAMSLSGVGMVEGDRAEQMFELLADSAQFESTGSISGSQVLLIELDNGAAVQMTVRNDRLASCGVWSCPEFFEAFGK